MSIQNSKTARPIPMRLTKKVRPSPVDPVLLRLIILTISSNNNTVYLQIVCNKDEFPEGNQFVADCLHEQTFCGI